MVRKEHTIIGSFSVPAAVGAEEVVWCSKVEVDKTQHHPADYGQENGIIQPVSVAFRIIFVRFSF